MGRLSENWLKGLADRHHSCSLGGDRGSGWPKINPIHRQIHLLALEIQDRPAPLQGEQGHLYKQIELRLGLGDGEQGPRHLETQDPLTGWRVRQILDVGHAGYAPAVVGVLKGRPHDAEFPVQRGIGDRLLVAGDLPTPESDVSVLAVDGELAHVVDVTLPV
jgi:hypothetical protein